MDKIINKSIDKLKTKPKNDFTANYNYDDDSISALDKTEYDNYDINSKIRIYRIIDLIMMMKY